MIEDSECWFSFDGEALASNKMKAPLFVDLSAQ